jgi:hypothetical protein
VATLSALSDRLRAELGDMGKSFVFQATGDGTTRRFSLGYAPLDGTGLTVTVAGTDVSSNCSVEEITGTLIFNTAPANHAAIVVSGTYFRYFTTTEIESYVNTAFLQHSKGKTDVNGSLTTLSTLPAVEEYPLVILASSMALYTLATDSSFDINIFAPDGVSIPRSERYRQLMEMVQARKEQYRELCTLLGIGLYGIEIFTLRRISRTTNRYVPVYIPQEVDDGSLPRRAQLRIPTYGAEIPESLAITQDLILYGGDDYAFDVTFDFDLTTYTPLAQIRLFPSPLGNQVGPVVVDTFTITKQQPQGASFPNTLYLTLLGSKTKNYPKVAYYDVQLTDSAGRVHTYVKGRILTESQVSQ